MADSNDDETDLGSLPVPVVPAQTVTQDGSPDLVAWVRTTLEGPELHPLTRDDTDQMTHCLVRTVAGLLSRCLI